MRATGDGAGWPGRACTTTVVNATGPRLKFGATEGLGPQHGHASGPTADHAIEAAARSAESSM